MSIITSGKQYVIYRNIHDKCPLEQEISNRLDIEQYMTHVH